MHILFFAREGHDPISAAPVGVLVNAMKVIQGGKTSDLGYCFVIVQHAAAKRVSGNESHPFKGGIAIPLGRGERVLLDVGDSRLEVALTSMGQSRFAWNRALGEIETPDPELPDDIAAARAWVRTGEHGNSSLAMCMALYEIPELGSGSSRANPHDPSDFRRCVLFLEAVPSARPRLHELAGLSVQWSRLVEHWEELEALYQQERGKKKAPLLYQRMKEVLAGN